VFRYLGRSFEKISTLGRLAALYRRLHRTELARDYEQRYLAVFQRRMHRVSAVEVASVAAQRYLPLAALRQVRLISPPPAHGARSRRGRALEAFLGGDIEAARTGFHGGGELLDAKYLADLALLEGDAAKARDGFLEALRADPDDARVLAAVLALADRESSAE